MTDQASPGRTRPAARRGSIWNDRRFRAILYQILVIGGVILLAVYLVSNTLDNLETRQIRTGFGFLDREAGFNIGESVISYQPADSYFRAFMVGVLNTLRVSLLGIVLATIIGTIIGIARLSRNWLIAKLASAYVEILRNIPLLLQLFFWYAVMTGLLPITREALNIMPGVYLSSSGLQYPVPNPNPVYDAMGIVFLLGIVVSIVYHRWVRKRQEATGQRLPELLPVFGMIVGLPALVFLIGGAPVDLDTPEWRIFNFQGGGKVSPEFLA
ncbi:MAG TPA: ABC transporter permease subunit, partial [Gammaproteobacteria bacterium]|nr:ABC transporter permease subunit [Gammaproteobacteria bacterium]